MKYHTLQIVKIGTQALFRENDRIDINKINDVGHDVKYLRNHKGVMTILVTSGAISLGRMAQTLDKLDDHIAEAKVAASIGQLELMELYKLSIGEQIAQLLITHQGLDGSSKEEAFANLIRSLISKGIFPVINYNDPMDDYELDHTSNFTDNDKLTARVAKIVGADRVIILTNVDGLLDKSGQIIKEIDSKANYKELLSLCEGKSNKGTGGMASKVKIAEELVKNNQELIIANSKYSLAKIVSGETPKTHFKA